MVRTEQGVRFSEAEASTTEPTDELMDFILSEERAESPGRATTRSPPSVVSPTKSSSSEEEDPEETMKSILAKLIDDVKYLQSGKQNTAIKFGGLGFADLVDCSAWISKTFEGYQYGLIMDPLLMLDRIYGEDDVTDSDAFSKRWKPGSYKMKIDSGSEAAALYALKYARPRVFHKGRPTIVSILNKSRLNLIPTHSDLNPGGEGIIDFCVFKLNELEEAITGEISETFEVKPSK